MPLPPRITGAQWQALRKQAGLSVQDLARLLACSPQTIYNIESDAAKNVGQSLFKFFTVVLNPTIRALMPLAEDQFCALLTDLGVADKKSLPDT